MRVTGFFSLSIGIILLITAAMMNTTVGGFYNIGLLNTRQNLFILSGFVILIGIVLIVADTIKGTKISSTNSNEDIDKKNQLEIADENPYKSNLQIEGRIVDLIFVGIVLVAAVVLAMVFFFK